MQLKKNNRLKISKGVLSNYFFEKGAVSQLSLGTSNLITLQVLSI